MRTGRVPLLVLAAAALAAACRDAPAEPVSVLVDADVVYASDSAREPEQRRLPHAWTPAERAEPTQATYRLAFSLDRTPNEPWAVYLPEVRMNAAVSVNGRPIGDGGRLSSPVARNWNRPLLFSVPAALLRSGANEVSVLVVADPSSQPRLAPVYVGPDREIRPAYETASFLKIDVRVFSIGALVVVALWVAVLVARGAARPESLWLAALAVLFAFGQLDAVLRDIPVSTHLWQWSNAVAYLACAGCFVVVVHRALGIRERRTELALGAALALFATWLATVDALGLPRAVGNVLLVCALPVAYALVRGLVSGRGPMRTRIALLCLGVLVIAALEARDAAQGPRVGEIPFTSFLPLLLAAFVWRMLLVHLDDVLARAERVNRDLDDRIAERSARLARVHDELRSAEREQVLASERERLAREMHDGAGGTLVSVLAAIESGTPAREMVADSLREALDEMRFALHALDQPDDSLLGALALARSRLATRLERTGIALDWHVGPHAEAPPLDAAHVHHILRIVQEAVANVLRHARARRVAVRIEAATRDDLPGVRVEIADDGRGMGPDDVAAARGRGLLHMQRRAREMGTALEVESDDTGTRVALWVPAVRRAPAATTSRIDGVGAS